MRHSDFHGDRYELLKPFCPEPVYKCRVSSTGLHKCVTVQGGSIRMFNAPVVTSWVAAGAFEQKFF